MDYKEYADLESGEIKSGVLITPEEYEYKVTTQENKAKYLSILKKQNEFKISIENSYGSFYFNNYLKLIHDMDGDMATAFRFLYLCTYADYDNIIRFYAKKSDFNELFNVSDSMGRKIWKSFIDNKLISIQDDGKIMVNDKYCNRGQLSKDSVLESTRVFDNGIQELYNMIQPREHKIIGSVICLLPFLNKEYNIICDNPLEINMNYIKPLSLNDIAAIIGIDESNIGRFKNRLISIKINGLPFIAYVEQADADFFMINPAVFYKGSNINNMDFYKALFNIKNKNNKSNKEDLLNLYNKWLSQYD